MLGDLLALVFAPVAWLMRLIFKRHQASQQEIKRFYRSAEWKRLRFAQLQAEPSCKLCGASAKSGARMNVDDVLPLYHYWHLRLSPGNLQTLCASCNWGKGGSEKGRKQLARNPFALSSAFRAQQNHDTLMRHEKRNPCKKSTPILLDWFHLPSWRRHIFYTKRGLHKKYRPLCKRNSSDKDSGTLT